MSGSSERGLQLFKALGDASRLQILEILWEEGRERCACVLLLRLGISQSTLSHHMKILCDAGLVAARKDGKWTHYAIRPEGFLRASALLNRLAHPQPPEEESEETSLCGI